jgi:translation initiation factor 4E
VRPEWEDVNNKHGGKWSYSFRDKKLININDLWMHVMLAGIGETLEDEDDGEVMGVVVNVRKGFYRIGLWTKSTGKPFPGGGDGNTAGGKGRSTQQGQEVLLKIGERFKNVLAIKDSDQVEFSGHVDAAHSGSTRAKAKLTI